MFWLILLNILSIDTLKYDDGTAEGFYTGDSLNDKFAVQFTLPYAPSKISGVTIFADNPDGFTYGALCPDKGGVPDTLNPSFKIDTVYSGIRKWAFTPMETEFSSIMPIWFVMRTGIYPGIGGDADSPNGHSLYYSSSNKSWQTAPYNWLIRLIVEKDSGYYENFLHGRAGYTGNWAFGVPKFITDVRDSCFGTQIDSLYPPDADLELKSPWIKMIGIPNPILRFRHFYKTEFISDGGNVKISSDDVHWQLITPTSGYDTVLITNSEHAFSGNSNGWRNVYFTLPSWDSLRIKWTFVSDGSVSDLGWFIDEVNIAEILTHDVSTTAINFSGAGTSGFVPADTNVIPVAAIKNLGINKETNFLVKCDIESSGVYIYQNQVMVNSISDDSTINIAFPAWHTGAKGSIYNIRIYTGLSNDENHSNDTLTTELEAFTFINSFQAPYTSTAPVLDGVIDSVEWHNAVIVDGSDVLGVDTADAANTCLMYFMYDASNLYIGVKAKSPQEIRIYMDDQCDRKWGPKEGFYWVTKGKAGFYDMYYSLVDSLPKALWAISDSGMEIKIPAGNEPYDFSGLDSLGCFIYAKADSEYIGWWPQTIPYTEIANPDRYARVFISDFGIEEGSEAKGQGLDLKVYPNPARGKVLIQYVGKAEKYCQLSIYDICGREVYKVKSEKLKVKSQFDISKLKSGIYFIHYKSSDRQIIKKITVIN